LKFISRISQWLHYWNNPVDRVVIVRLEEASKAAGNAMGQSRSFHYLLLTGRKQIAIAPVGVRSTSSLLRIVTAYVQGRPTKVSLYQENAIGLLGPFAKARKSSRGTRKQTRENAILFWPCPSGRTTEGETRHVLKVSLENANLARETKALKTVSGELQLAPKVIANDRRLNWLVMDFVVAIKSLSPREQARLYLERIARPYFTYFGIVSRPVAEHLRQCRISRKQFIAAARELGLDGAEECLSGNLGYSITHGGGICEECVLGHDDQVYLLDWEKAQLGAIADDFLQVFEYLPDQTIEVMEEYAAGDLSAIGQLKTQLICRYQRHSRKKSPKHGRLKADRICAELLRVRGVSD
jgi:hypothetical protein